MIYFVLAAYNEEQDLPRLLDEFKGGAFGGEYRIIIVDDGSTDATAAVAERYGRELPLTLVRHPANRGLGGALSTGMRTVRPLLREGDAVITMDADNTHPVALSNAMAERLREGSCIVIASRFCPGGQQSGLPFYRRLLSRGAGLLLSVVWPLKNVRDYTSGYRCFSAKLLEDLFAAYGEKVIEETGFSATVELLLKASRLCSRITEVPLDLHYEKKTGASKLRVLRTVGAYLRLILRLRLHL